MTVTPGSGSGNGVLQNTGSVHTGRLVRSGVVTVTAVGVAQPKTYNVTQEAKPEFITIDNGADMAADKLGGKVTVTGKSNSAALTFAWVGDDLEATIAAQYTAGGKSTTNGESIEGDPGATAEYNWSVELTLPENETVDQVDRTLKVSNGSSVSQQIVIQQTAGDATLSLSEIEITIPADGSAVSVNVTSNTSWTVS
ncbi:BACON domain-containing protein [Bacteroides sp. AN502]|nr:BACON domain-containing protein [Caecibacteroides pullorum]MDC6279757.1 BACON domain-containing protein [Caecibacteroides pullorum]